MDAQTLLRTNGAKAGELVLAIGEAAGAVAKAIEDAAGPLAEMIEDRAETLAKTVEERGTPLAGAVGTTVEALAKSVEERAVPLAGAVGTTVETLADDFEEKFEKARKEVTSSVKSFRFGTREGVILGMALGVFAAVWLIKRMDRQAARERLRAASSKVGETTQAMAGRFGEATQGLTSRVGEATHGLSERAGVLASQAGDRVGQVAQTASSRAGEVLQQVRGGQAGHTVEDAKLRLSDPTSPVREVVISESRNKEDVGSAQQRETGAGSDLDKDTQAAIDDAVKEVERVQEETLEEAQKLGLSNGMKIVAFDGTDIGRVQEVREKVFVLDRPKGPDLLVPLTEVARIEGTVAYLRVEADRVTKMGWEKADKS